MTPTNARRATFRMEFRTTIIVEVYRCAVQIAASRWIECHSCRAKRHFSKRFEDAVGQACESAAARQVALRFGLASSRCKDLRYLLLKAQRMAATRTEFVAFRKAAQNAVAVAFLFRAQKNKPTGPCSSS
jgi:hypothetical protein